MQKKYAVAGLYVEGSALFDSIYRGRRYSTRTRPPSTIRRPCSLLRWTQTASTAPYSLLRQCRAQPEAFSVLASALDGSAARPALLEYTPGGTLAVSYPADGAAVYTSACFVMGTSDPAQELLLNGTPVESRGQAEPSACWWQIAKGGDTYTLHTGRNQRLCDREPARARRRRERRPNGGPPRRHCRSGTGHACAHPKLDRQPAV